MSSTRATQLEAGSTIPRVGSHLYTRKDYWESRFAEEDAYEWLAGWENEHFRTAILSLLPLEKYAHSKILLVGTGNSRLPFDMALAGYTNLVATDYSATVIARMKAKCNELVEESEKDMISSSSSNSTNTTSSSSSSPSSSLAFKNITWEVQDMTNLTYEDASFDVVLDKAAMDAILADGGDVWDPPSSLLVTTKKVCSSVSRVLRRRQRQGGGGGEGHQQQHTPSSSSVSSVSLEQTISATAAATTTTTITNDESRPITASTHLTPTPLYLQLSFSQPHFRKKYLLQQQQQQQQQTHESPTSNKNNGNNTNNDDDDEWEPDTHPDLTPQIASATSDAATKTTTNSASITSSSSSSSSQNNTEVAGTHWSSFTVVPIAAGFGYYLYVLHPA